MRSQVEDLETRLMPGRVPFVALGIVGITTAFLWAACLPVVPTHTPDIQQVSTVFRPQWLIAATLLALPLNRLAAWRCWVGVLSLVLAGALTLAITDEAVDRVRAAGIDLAGTESVWMVLAGCQVVVFAIATGQGLKQRMFHRRCQRLTRRLAATTSDSTLRVN